MEGPAAASLDALRDIHLPAPVPFWPPAPGWWGLAALLVVLTVASIWILRARRRRAISWQQAARDELCAIEIRFERGGDVVELARELSALLRRAVLVRFPGERVAALHGEDWYALLGRDAPDAEPRPLESVRELTRTAYAGTAAAVEPEAWIAFTRSWIGDAR